MFESCICDIDAEPPDVQSEETRTARKTHTCCECGEDIQPGQRYLYFRGKYSGGWIAFKTCLPCAGVREAVCRCGYAFGALRETFWDCYGFDYVDNHGIEGIDQ